MPALVSDRFHDVLGAGRGGDRGADGRDRDLEGVTLTRVGDLRAGMLVDLAHDAYADPAGANPVWEYEYETVETVQTKVDGATVVVHFYDATVAFPAAHRVRVADPEH